MTDEPPSDSRPMCAYHHATDPDVRPADWAYIGESGDYFVCDMHFQMRTEAGKRNWHRIDQTVPVPDRRADEPPFGSRDDLRRDALVAQAQHDPANQPNNGYDRCEHCHYTRHPCEVYELATAVLWLLDEGRDGTMESSAD